MPVAPTDRGRLLDVKAVRRTLGIAQVKLARLLGVSPMTVSLWERGLRIPTAQHRALMQLLIDDQSLVPKLVALIDEMEFGPIPRS